MKKSKLKKCPDINSPEYEEIINEYVSSLTMISYNPLDIHEISAWFALYKPKGANILEIFNKVCFQDERDAVLFKLWYKEKL